MADYQSYDLTDPAQHRALLERAEAEGLVRHEGDPVEDAPEPEPKIVCPHCGNDKQFERWQTARELILIDNQGHLIEALDWEFVSEQKRVRCRPCRKKFTP